MNGNIPSMISINAIASNNDAAISIRLEASRFSPRRRRVLWSALRQNDQRIRAGDDGTAASPEEDPAPPFALRMKRKKSLFGSTTITSPAAKVFLYASRL